MHTRWAVEYFHKKAKQLLGMDRFEGHSWTGWHHQVTMVLVAYAFLSTLRLEAEGEEGLPPLRARARILVLEMATQRLTDEHGFDRAKATAVAETMLGFRDWLRFLGPVRLCPGDSRTPAPPGGVGPLGNLCGPQPPMRPASVGRHPRTAPQAGVAHVARRRRS